MEDGIPLQAVLGQVRSPACSREVERRIAVVAAVSCMIFGETEVLVEVRSSVLRASCHFEGKHLLHLLPVECASCTYIKDIEHDECEPLCVAPFNSENKKIVVPRFTTLAKPMRPLTRHPPSFSAVMGRQCSFWACNTD